LGILRKRLGLPKLSLPEGLRNLLRLSGYILLSVILLTSIIAACEFLPWKIRHSLYIAGCQMCPSRFTFPYLVGFPIVHTFGGPGLVPAILIILFCIAIIFTSLLGLGFIFRRPWCMVCPNGVLLSIFNRGSMITKEKESLRCTGCGACFNGCSMQGDFIYHQRRQRIVNHADCILCFRCVDLCPQGDCLKVKFMGLVIFRSK
jgi:polyferredoxin